MNAQTYFGLKPWKIFQEKYYDTVLKHTRLSEQHMQGELLIDNDMVVENAMSYVKEKNAQIFYPGAAYIHAIVFAKLISETYSVNFLDILDDLDLFLGKSRYFVRYNSDKASYNAILKQLEDIPNWMASGWASESVELFHAQCTEEGLNAALNRYIQTGDAALNAA
jgi:hypothetical protein